VKELKRLDVAGSATENAEKDFFIQWHLTERCNLRCRHCYQTTAGSAEMDLGEIAETADEVSDMLKRWAESYDLSFLPSFTVTGGEPLVRKDLFDILHLLSNTGFETYLLTNGTLIDREAARRLKDTITGIQVSIEGPEAVHDSIRGAGTFARAVAGVKEMVTVGIPVSLNATISRMNAHHLPALIALGRNLGVKKVGFSRLVPQGNGAALSDSMLTAGEVLTTYRSLLSLGNDGVEVSTGDPLATILDAPITDSGVIPVGGRGRKPLRDAGAVPVGGCAAGISGLTILADGTVTPCRRLPIPLGNVRKDSLRQIWAESPILSDLRDRSKYTGNCGTCPRWAVCRGCRAIAYACNPSGAGAGNGFLGDDPQCFAAL
jgi:AdoMet-dependent heme synthase